MNFRDGQVTERQDFELQRRPGAEEGGDALHHSNHNGWHGRHRIEAAWRTQGRRIGRRGRSRFYLNFMMIEFSSYHVLGL